MALSKSKSGGGWSKGWCGDGGGGCAARAMMVAACARLRIFISNIAARADYCDVRAAHQRVEPRVAIMWPLAQGACKAERRQRRVQRVSPLFRVYAAALQPHCSARDAGRRAKRDGYPSLVLRSRTPGHRFEGQNPSLILEARMFSTVWEGYRGFNRDQDETESGSANGAGAGISQYLWTIAYCTDLEGVVQTRKPYSYRNIEHWLVFRLCSGSPTLALRTAFPTSPRSPPL